MCILLCLFSALLLLSCQALTPEEQAALEVLQQSNKEISASNFTTTQPRNELYLFNNIKEKAFALVASSTYQPCLGGNLVLAYSTDNNWGTQQNMDRILDYYSDMLTLLQAQKLQVEKAEQQEVAPLLQTHWSQGKPYNTECPKVSQENCLAGCIPVAMGQVIHYYQPVKSNRIPALLASVGQNVGAQYSKTNTIANTLFIKTALVDNFGCSPRMQSLSGSSDNYLSLITEEVKAKRPVILSNVDHAFVCDGVRNDYLHLNMGWGGYYDGYYRQLACSQLEGAPTFFRTLIADIQPGEEERAVNVTVTKAGTLAQQLSHPETITKLTIQGNLNGDDLMLLRKLAGAYPTASDRGILQHLDLSKAHFTSGGTYLEQDAAQSGFIYRKNGATFNFKQMTALTWKRFCQNGYQHTAEYDVVKKNDGYYLQFHLLPRIVGTYLFSGCENLQTLQLPTDIQQIRTAAFSGCHLLQELELPRSVTSIAANSFTGLHRCRRLLVHTAFKVSGKGLIYNDVPSYFKIEQK